MEAPPVNRRLAAILAADIAGYSRLMAADEEATLRTLADYRLMISDFVAKHGGRIFGTAGDSVIVEFASAVNSVRAAVAIQQALQGRNADLPKERRMEFRIGINVGDVVEQDGDIFGDGVNIAARLEGIAEAGGICVSARVQEDSAGRIDLIFEDIGEQILKNIARPIRAYRLRPSGATVTNTTLLPALSLSDKPVIAVLPFANMSSDPEQEYFGEGLAEDLITDLSKVPGLMVIARNSSFVYTGKSADIRSVAKDLGARYVVEGSVRRAASRVRINAQLIDAHDHSHVWADRFDGDLADVFALQDAVVAQIVSALSKVISASAPAGRRRTTSIEAYDLFVRARALLAKSLETSPQARPLLDQALVLDPEFAGAYATLALCHWMGWLHLGEAREPNRTLALSAARSAVAIDPNDAGGHMILGIVRLYDFEHAEAKAAFETALRIDPNHADSWALMADLLVMQGRSRESVTSVRNALRLNPHPPGWYYWALGQAQYADRSYSDAVETLRRKETHRTPSQRILAASLVRLGRSDEAVEEARMFMEANPHFGVQKWVDSQPFEDARMREHFTEGYLKAGLPA